MRVECQTGGLKPGCYAVLVLGRLQVMAEGTKRILEQLPGRRFQVCAATNLNPAMQELKRRFVHCVLVDLDYPDVMEVIAKISACSPDSRILVYTNEDPAPYFNRMIEAGAVGFVNQSGSPEHLADMILAAVEGRIYIPIRLIRELRRTVLYVEHPDGVKCEAISEREEEALKYLALGYTYKETAARMYISQRSVEHLVSHLYRKFGVASRKDLINKAREVRLLPLTFVN